MAPSSKLSSLTADQASLILSCAKGNHRQQFFIDHLGLPQQKDQRDRRGVPQFDGPAARHCGNLYKAMYEALPELQRHFKAKGDLRRATPDVHLSLADELSRPIITIYGPIIWGATEPFVTRVNQSFYSQRLRHDIEEDCEK
jgi:hypothetical protein